MSVFIASLNSGSNGNCYYVGNSQEAVLIDVGISCSEVEKRMLRIGLNIGLVKAIVVSHEHSDHIRGIAVLAKKYHLPVYITDSTFANSRLDLDKNLVRVFQSNKPIYVGNLQINPFSKYHDAADPHSFTISYNSITIGVFTDLGIPCKQLIAHFKACHAAFLEANYDEELLASGHYPYMLKNRITGGKGHLSNRQAFELYCRHRPAFMQLLLLSHLSKDNNCPKLVKQLFETHNCSTQIVIASRYEETAIYQIKIAYNQSTQESLQQLELFN